jgi:hypothetical protein
MLVSGAAGARSRDCTVQLAVVSTAAVMVALSAVSQALKYVYPAQGLWCMACKELTAVAASSKVPAEDTSCCWKGCRRNCWESTARTAVRHLRGRN